jgi:GH24 family phage-related lysozyme (muramidase)
VKLSARGANLIATFEGFRSCPYRDAVGVWTIGFGSTRGVGPNSRCMSRAEALERMMREVDATYGAAINRLGLPLNQNQFDALTSFVYNVGPGGVAASTTVGKRLRARDWDGAANALLAWDKAGGRTLLGLTRRRQAERALFLSKSNLKPTIRFPYATDSERRWLIEYGDRFTGAARRAVLRRYMTRQRKRIWRVAQPKAKGGDGAGWTKSRRARYASLLARTK